MRIHILGASGSGVTTLGEKLAARWQISYFDSDAFFWEKTDIPFSIKKDPKQRDEELLYQLHHTEHWILGGSILQWSKAIHALFDYIVFLHIPQTIRLERLKKREMQRYGEHITSDPLRKKKFEDFIRWAKDYDEDTGIAYRTLKKHKHWLKAQKVPIVEIVGDVSVNQRIQLVENAVQDQQPKG